MCITRLSKYSTIAFEGNQLIRPGLAHTDVMKERSWGTEIKFLLPQNLMPMGRGFIIVINDGGNPRIMSSS